MNKDQNEIETTELTPEQLEAIEENVRKTMDRIDKGKKIWNKIKTPLIVAGSVVGGFILRGALTSDECPYEDDDEEDFEEYEDEQ